MVSDDGAVVLVVAGVVADMFELALVVASVGSASGLVAVVVLEDEIEEVGAGVNVDCTTEGISLDSKLDSAAPSDPDVHAAKARATVATVAHKPCLP